MCDTRPHPTHPPSFEPSTVEAFHFVRREFDECTGVATLVYAFAPHGPTFREEIVFPPMERVPLDAHRRAALERCLDLLHLVAGISYYKAALPETIRVETGPLTPDMARFLDTLYLHGLGELAFRNGVDLRGRIHFPASGETSTEPPPRLELARRTAIPVGGGKDSIVTIEALARAGEPRVLLSVGDPEPIRAVSEVAGSGRIVLSRRLAPELLELNRRGAINGHVPISAILGSIFAVAAVLYDFDAAALSNERSADEGNLVWDGFEINHQYSKSSRFEKDFQALLDAHVLPGFHYFSFLRPFSELAITALFSQANPRYRKVFRSCNAAFRLDESMRARRWCCDCPKCRFVFLALAPFLAKPEMVDIFGADLLDDPAQAKGFEALFGLGEHKPFECVGEVRECVAALALLARSPEWREDLLVARFAERILPEVDADALLREAFEVGSRETLPSHFRALLPTLPTLLEARHADR